jgi:hypothetical protein
MVAAGYLGFLAALGTSAALIRDDLRQFTHEQVIKEKLSHFVTLFNEGKSVGEHLVAERLLENFPPLTSIGFRKIRDQYLKSKNPELLKIRLSVEVRELLIDESIAFNFNTWTSRVFSLHACDALVIEEHRTMDVWRNTNGVWKLYRSHVDEN